MNKISPRPLAWALLILVCLHLVFLQLELYFHIGWLDMLMHFSGGLLFGLAGICIIFAKTNTPKNVSNVLIILISTFSALFVGGLWEVVELNSNSILGFELVKITNGKDTLSDLLFDFLGALSGAVYFILAKNKYS